MKQCFRETAFRQDTRDMIDECCAIVEDYQEQGLRLTLRQLYYQLVSANKIKNEEKSHKRLGSIVSDARLAGLMDWAAIEDRGRVVEMSSEWKDVASLVESALYAYRLPRWKDQDNYVELWVEKQALAGVLAPIAAESHVALMVNKGYSSQSAMYEASRRFLRRQQAEKSLHLLYLGDHDPSGEDMVRDVGARLEMFGVEDLHVNKLALTTAQIKQYKPPPNPAKMTDSRAPAYVAEHGNNSWGVDALPPAVLAKLIRSALANLTDADEMRRVKCLEDNDRARLRSAAAEIAGIDRAARDDSEEEEDE